MLAGTLLAAQQTLKPPVTWDEAALREWATPIAGLNVRPGHFSPEEYHKAPVDNLRTYPVYFPGANRQAIGRCCSRSVPSR